ncbi:MAG TPA: isoprenylcysteine carboxylmethyltransferase family protein [Longimicrobiaceae bacterium]|nr:isoprenylcysteine carboxylmethyltransferase family protein [Longimicrobiaceae bacterium]
MIWLRTLCFALTFVATALVLLPLWVVGWQRGERIFASSLAAAGIVPLALGVALMLWCWWDFAVRGRGTPAPFDPPRALVIAGPYRYVRNPMYIAAGLVLLGEAAIFGAPRLLLYGLAFAAVAHSFVVLYEERTLRRRFGADYDTYRAAVHRWLPAPPRR